MDHRKRPCELSDDDSLQLPSKKVSSSRSPVASPSPNSITTSDRESVLVGSSVSHLEAVMQESGDGLAVTLSREMEVLYDPLSGTRVTPQNNEADTLITEYDLPSLSQAVSRMYGSSDFF